MAHLLLRATLFASLILLAVYSISDYNHWQQGRNELVGLLAGSGPGAPSLEVLGDIRTEPDPLRAELRAARALLAEELERGRSRRSPLEEDRTALLAGLENLRRAREMASRALRKRPAAWQAAMVLGGATYLERSRSRNPGPALEREIWVAPLELARQLGPGQPEPLRFLIAGRSAPPRASHCRSIGLPRLSRSNREVFARRHPAQSVARSLGEREVLPDPVPVVEEPGPRRASGPQPALDG